MTSERHPRLDPAARPAGLADPHARGWSVISPAGAEHAADLVEGLSLADLVAEEFGVLRRARPHRPPLGPRPAPAPVDDAGAIPSTRGSPRWSAPSPSSSTPWPPGSPPNGPSASSPSGTASAPAPPSSRCAGGPRPRAARSPSWPARYSTAWAERCGCGPPAPAPVRAVGAVAAVPAVRGTTAGARRSLRRTAGPDPAGTAHPLGPGRPARRTPRRRAARAGATALRVAVDGPDAAAPGALADGDRRAAAGAGPARRRRPGRRASTGRRRCAWSTAAPTPTPATPTGWTPAR